MFVCSLGSGSSGNATLVRGASGRTALIDCGVQYPRLIKHLARLGVQPAEIDAVILSHEHSDHTQAAPMLRDAWKRRIIASPELAREAIWLRDVVTDIYTPDSAWPLGDLTITPCRVTHDASSTYGFVIQADGCTVAIFTDLGIGSETVIEAAAAADLIVMEANYDRTMLDNGSYPWFLKSRIKGRGGHLSNADCADLLVRAFTDDRSRDVWLAHLSANNNSPEIAVTTVSGALDAAGIARVSVTALPRYALGPRWECVRRQQLTLFP